MGRTRTSRGSLGQDPCGSLLSHPVSHKQDSCGSLGHHWGGLEQGRVLQTFQGPASSLLLGGLAGTNAGQVGTCSHAPTTSPAQRRYRDVPLVVPPNRVGCQHPQGLCPPRAPRCRCCDAQQPACLCRSTCPRTVRLSHKCECPHPHRGAGGTSWLAQGRRGCLTPPHPGSPAWGHGQEPQQGGRGWPPPCVPSLALRC